jgi:hypothetical protein
MQIAGQAKGSRGLGIPNGGMQKGPGDDRHWHFGMGWDGMGVLIHYCILILLINTNEICLLYIEWGKAVASALAVGDNER